MFARFTLIAAATLTSATAFAAEPVRAPVQPTAEQPAQPHSASPQIVLASAGIATPAAASEPKAATPAKRRVGRVTTCRCGGQTGQAEPAPEPEQ